MRLLKQAAIFAALIFAIPAFWPVAVFAQEVATSIVPHAEPTFDQQLVLAIMPAVGLILTALATWAAAEFHRRTGITIEASHRDALQSALMNGILFALQKAGWVPGQPTDKLLGLARVYVQSSVPDALNAFGIDAATSVGAATLDRLLTPKLPVPAGTVMPNGDKLVGPVS